MRTTVTIDDEVARLLKEAMHRRRTNFKEALNAALRRGLTGTASTVAPPKRFTVKGPFLGQLRHGLDPSSFNKLATDLEDEHIVRQAQEPGGK